MKLAIVNSESQTDLAPMTYVMSVVAQSQLRYGPMVGSLTK